LFRGRIKVMSTIASHSPLNISETVRDDTWFQRTTKRKWPTANQNGHATLPRKVKLVTQIRLEPNISKNSWRMMLLSNNR